MSSALALEWATQLARGEALHAPQPAAALTRTVAIGDPQARAAHFFAVLQHHELLGEAGFLRPDVQLISIGDHFDFGGSTDSQDGLQILGWLAAHSPRQVPILLGNHDIARVCELRLATDERFGEARRIGGPLVELKGEEERRRIREEWLPRFPELPRPGLVARDYAAFSVAQRQLVQRLLVEHRFRLGIAASREGRPILLTHAGVTARELDQLSLPLSASPLEIATALDQRLEAAVDQVAGAWASGRPEPLHLEPLHVPGLLGIDGDDALPEGGGLLYHRPSDPSRPNIANPDWERDNLRPRRFHPRTLPLGLVQAAGHTGHGKCHEEMPRWREPEMKDEPGGIRTLIVSRGDVRYVRGAASPRDGEAILYLIDPTLHKMTNPAAVPLFELTPGSA